MSAELAAYATACEELRALYRVHDHLEDALRDLTRHGAEVFGTVDLWAVHDRLERRIITIECALPDDALETLHAERGA